MQSAKTLCGADCSGPTGGTAGTGEGGAGGCSGALGGLCASSSECNCDQICSKFDEQNATVSCQNPKASGAATGEPCIGNGACISNACDSFARTCTVGCKGAIECGAGNVCGRTFFSQTKFYDQCFKGCKRDSDCPTNIGGSRVCFLKQDADTDILVFACTFLGQNVGDALPGGGVWRGFGETMGANDGCYSGLALANGYCSKACDTNADCAAPLAKCGNINATPPSGSGTTLLRGCVP